MTETASRLLELLALLQARRGWPGAELARRLEVTERTVRRDVGRLRRARLSGGVAERPRRRLPPARRARRCRRCCWTRRRRSRSRWGCARRPGGGDRDRGDVAARPGEAGAGAARPPAAAGRARSAPPSALPQDAGPTVDPQHLALLAAAAATASACGSATAAATAPPAGATWSRTPWSPSGGAGTWWAWDVTRGDWRTFRIDRIASPSLAGHRFGPRELPATATPPPTSPRGGGRARAATPPSSPSTCPPTSCERRFGAGWGTVTAIDDGTCEFRTGDDDLPGWRCASR